MTDDYHCDHERTELRKRTYSNGSVHYVDQCLRCGRELRSYKKTSQEVHIAYSLGDIPAFDGTLRDRFWQQWEQARVEKRQADREEWFAWYNEYLHSPEWQARRLAILERDKYICQGCLGRKATTAHHLTYKHAGNEFLFEIVAVCQECHNRLHEDKQHDYAGGGIGVSG